ncbi:hypothetical protein VPHD148_0183 [Vibrio phage D148]
MKRNTPELNLTFSGDLLATLSEARNQKNVTFNAIRECEEIIQDCMHYLELYSLPGGKMLAVTKVLREALRRKRQMQDEHVLICAALGDIDSGIAPRNYKETYEYHEERITGERSYRPRQVTLNEILGIEEEVRKVDPKFNHLNKYTSKGINNDSNANPNNR